MWQQWAGLVITIAILVAVGYLLMKLFRFELREFVKRLSAGQALDESVAQWAEEVAHVLRWAVILVLAIVGVFFFLRAMGYPIASGWEFGSLINWLSGHGVRVVLLLAGSYLGIKIANLLLSKAGLLIRPYDDTPAAEMERQKRAGTITGILQKVATVAIIGIAGLMVLGEFNINITPILTSVGVAGIAIGFGAQQLVADFFAGFFIILENRIRVGDVASLNGTGGLVEDISLRTTTLRGLDGTVHSFRNGTIQTISNMTKGFSFYVVDLGVAYKEDTDRVCQVVREVVAEMQADEKFGPSILEPVEILGVDQFGESEVVIKLRIKTLPIKQWEVGREFRRRIKYRFDKEGIEIPFPHHSIYFGEASKPFDLTIHNSGDLRKQIIPHPAETGGDRS